ncbi:thiamine pyrophosphate-requiring protein [Noviherbaspirillum sp. CPCC 100848]|jgi:acetolactate synthase-1/2/3 large subunit|uniref:Thiamine pyrophosphate-requiring protein n=1 Tax=Noviherbaspirillum album TaxID=3080276 RepID=A0ABU6JA11_9BURK|nr:thiamine pyrophosphate-requiring protein [Noviherbaspirillum sp. CPCC 100848]MEC4720358.1 thiamine pyrophosphate-requiring protein [Noviherbaspirillum sp. CPCC 100848]
MTETGALTSANTISVAEAYLSLLHDRGIDFLYVGAGTDTAPVIEAYSRAEEAGLRFPAPILAVHENLAVGMAHGYTMLTGRPQAVMLHVTVGAANAVCAIMNAARAQIPVLFTAGRTPLLEEGRLGARSHEVHWAQEMYDQGGMLRELVKWDYELRDGTNVEQIIDRALGISMTEPRGPVYLTLPREVLAQEKKGCRLRGSYLAATSPHPAPHAVTAVARALIEAKMPVFVCTNTGANPATVALLQEIANRFGIGVAENKPRYMCFPSDHPLHLGFDMASVFREADALVFLDCDVPWIPALFQPNEDTFIAQVGPDPLFGNYPVRSFRSDVAITASSQSFLEALIPALAEAGGEPRQSVRHAAAASQSRHMRQAVALREQGDRAKGGPITKLFLSRCLQEVKSEDAIIVNEYPAMREQMAFNQPGTFFQLPSSGGLGWGMPAALGVQQAAPDKVVIAVLGDGAYLFANPAACHQAADMLRLPLLTVIFNNESWDAVQKAAQGMYANGHADQQLKKRGHAPISSLKPLPDFEKYVEASGGYGERVTERDQLIPALLRALHAVRHEKRQALLNVMGV